MPTATPDAHWFVRGTVDPALCFHCGQPRKAHPANLDEHRRMSDGIPPASEEHGTLVEALGTPWPLGDVLQRLIDAAKHLRDDHDCDQSAKVSR